MDAETTDIRAEAERRLEVAWELVGGELEFEDALVDLIQKIHRLCALVVDEETADPALDRLLAGRFPDEVGRGGWRAALAEDNRGVLVTETALGGLLTYLQIYAEYGVVGHHADEEVQRRALLAEWMERARLLLDFLPADAWGLGGTDIVRMLHRALARWKLDTDEPVTAEELSMLSGKALQTIRNKLAGDSREIVGTQRRIEAREARAWLAQQPHFNSSIWQQQDEAAPGSAGRVFEMTEVYFVPVGSDGTVFHPGLKKDGFYHVGGPGAESAVEAYGTALERLQRQVTPQWRRPTPTGLWTRVRATQWKRIDGNELEALRQQAGTESAPDA